MSILWADFPSGSPGLYDTNEDPLLNGIYAEVQSSGASGFQLIADPDPNVVGGIVPAMHGGSFGAGLRFVFPNGALTTVGWAGRLYMPALPADTSGLSAKMPLWQWRDNGNNTMVSIWVSTTGQLVVSTGDLGAEQGRTTLPVLVAQAWQHVEIKVVQSATAGAVTINIEGVQKLALTNINTGGTAYSQMFFGNHANGTGTGFGAGACAYKDVVWWDTNGSDNNDFLGSVQVYDLLLDGDSSLGWTPSTGSTGYDLLNEAPPDDDDYISADPTPPAPSIFTFGNLPSEVVGVRGLISIGRMRKTDGGDANVQMSFISNGSTDLGADRPITTAFTYYWDVSELSPDTGQAWNPIEVNNATVQIDRTV